MNLANSLTPIPCIHERRLFNFPSNPKVLIKQPVPQGIILVVSHLD